MALNTEVLKGTTSLVVGIANKFSIAYSIAERIRACGGDVIATYIDDRFEKKVRECTDDMGIKAYFHYDASDASSAKNLAQEIEKIGRIDNIVHAIARAERVDLEGSYFNVNAGNFASAMHVSCFSLTNLAKELYEVINDNGSIITMTYGGARQTVHNYNVMGVCKAALEASVRYLAVDCGKRGIRVNAVSAGPIKTLAASGVRSFNGIVDASKKFSPLGRIVTLEDISGTALFLLINDLSSGVTGQVIYVDCGVSAVAVPGDD